MKRRKEFTDEELKELSDRYEKDWYIPWIWDRNLPYETRTEITSGEMSGSIEISSANNEVYVNSITRDDDLSCLSSIDLNDVLILEEKRIDSEPFRKIYNTLTETDDVSHAIRCGDRLWYDRAC